MQTWSACRAIILHILSVSPDKYFFLFGLSYATDGEDGTELATDGERDFENPLYDESTQGKGNNVSSRGINTHNVN